LLKSSLNGRSPKRGSLYQDPPKGLPPNPPIGFYKWLTLNLKMFMLPWYPPVSVQSKPSSKLPYHKLQYRRYVQDINLDVHIKVFKKKIRVNGEIVEANIINLFGYLLKDNIYEWGKSFVQDHPNCTFEELEQTFCKDF
jgi:hypothetical protein